MENLNQKAKKRDRKQRKHQHVLEKETGAKCCSIPTANLAVCNAGLVNGLSEEILVENFITYGTIKSILMIPGKSCCFVTFNEINDAIQAYESTNGSLNIAQNNKPIYLSYVEMLPSTPIGDLLNDRPPGLILIENFISEIEEKALLILADFNEDAANMKHRKVKHYGYEFRYDINNVDKDCPMDESVPRECEFLFERLQSNGFDFLPDQLTINHYKPGQGIPPHIDTHSAFEDPLISLSLEGTVVMDFKHKSGKHMPVVVPRRSVLIMSSESRYDWTHGITPRKLDIIPTNSGLTVFKRNTRVSFTFRKIRQGQCNCTFKDNCDSYKKKSAEIKNESAINLENQYVHNVYENIASHFSETRHKPWPNVLNFVQSLETASILIDVGCGNGKYFGSNKNSYEIGSDVSLNLLSVCESRGFQALQCNCLNIPIKDCTADGVISIAVIHHLANEERRLNSIKEMVRILRIGGKALIYVWAKDQNKNREKTSYLKQDRKNRKKNVDLPSDYSNVSISNELNLPVHTNRTQFQHQDLLVPWKLKRDQKEDLFLRFYHVFDEGELVNLCSKLNNVEIVEHYYDQGNWCVVLKKIA